VKKRCICGRSASFPLCDESHVGSGWECGKEPADDVELAFVATGHLRNLADRLAHRFDGVSLHLADGPVRCRRLVTISDGHGLSVIEPLLREVQAKERVVVGVGVSSDSLRWAFPDAGWVTVEDDGGPTLWKEVERAVSGEPLGSADLPRPNIFVSHAVSDEPHILPALDALRNHFGMPLFVCADSIASGANWTEEIRDHLRRCDLFLFVASAASAQSSFCAFEVGMAMALEKRIGVVSIDDHSPPPYLQDLQAASVPRLLSRKPWLTADDGLLETILDAAAASVVE